MSLPDRIRAGSIAPWVGEGADGCRRSAQIVRDELATLDALDERRDELEAQAVAWEERAELIDASPSPDDLVDSCPACRDAPLTMVMCRRHWRKVPPALQREVYAAWEARRRATGDRTAADRHRAAKAAAIRAAFEV